MRLVPATNTLLAPPLLYVANSRPSITPLPSKSTYIETNGTISRPLAYAFPNQCCSNACAFPPSSCARACTPQGSSVCPTHTNLHYLCPSLHHIYLSLTVTVDMRFHAPQIYRVTDSTNSMCIDTLLCCDVCWYVEFDKKTPSRLPRYHKPLNPNTLPPPPELKVPRTYA